MTYRSRLFLKIGSLFILFFLISYFIEAYLLRKNLKESEVETSQVLKKTYERKRIDLEHFLGVNLADAQGKINAFLFHIQKSPNLFIPVREEESFVEAANFLLTHPWIDIIQIAYHEKNISGIIPSYHYLYKGVVQKQNQMLVVNQQPYSIQKIPQEMEEKVKKIAQLLDSSTVPSLYLLYPEHSPIPSFNQKEPFSSPKEQQGGLNGSYYKEKYLDSFQKNYAEHESLLLLWTLAYSFTQEIKKPVGIAWIEKNNQAKVIFTDHVFFQKQLYDPIPPSFEPRVIQDKRENNLFLSSSITVDTEKGKSSLIVGQSIRQFLSTLSIISESLSFLISGNEMIEAVDATGKPITQSLTESQKEKILKNRFGSISLNGNEYFFLHLQPLETLDLHFFILESKAKALSLLNIVQKESRELVHKISFHMRMIALSALLVALLILHFIAKEITKPINHLATAAKKVGEGHLDQLEMPQEHPKSKELVTLFNAFKEMIEGLKEKEKVRGVLNKVVSEEIAQEIIKGNVHLGGEEKEVTILFADIRGFTQLTEKMEPKEVILLLNECMTLITKVIDENKGVIDKFVGDEVMALFGAPIAFEDSTYFAVKAAKEILQKMNEWNQKREEEKKSPIFLGVGIDQGRVVAGNMGAEDRLNYTVLGSHVNLASRLCSQAKAKEILVSEAVVNNPKIKESFSFDPLEEVQLKGFSEKIKIFKLKE